MSKWLLILTIALFTGCGSNKELQVGREMFTLIAVEPVYRDGAQVAKLTWLDGGGSVLYEFKNYPVFELPGHHYAVRIVRNSFR